MNILIIADSRGFALQSQLQLIDWSLLGITLHVLAYSGATIRSGVTKALSDMGNMIFDIIYIFLGTNNLSHKIGLHDIIPIFSNRYQMIRILLMEFATARNRLSPRANRVIICELTGINFWLYNSASQRAFIVDQIELDAGIILLNDYIRDFNFQWGVYSPYIASITHKQRAEPNNLTHRYNATTHDGIHFKLEMNKKILDRFILNIIQSLNIILP